MILKSFFMFGNSKPYNSSSEITPLETLTSGRCCLLKVEVEIFAEIGMRVKFTYVAQPKGKGML